MDNNSGAPPVLEMFVLDVLQHDVAEQVPSILRLLNNRGCIGWRDFWPHDFSAEEVTAALRQLVHTGLVELFSEDHAGTLSVCDKPDWNAPMESLWFGIASAGRAKWGEWEPPNAVNPFDP